MILSGLALPEWIGTAIFATSFLVGAYGFSLISTPLPGPRIFQWLRRAVRSGVLVIPAGGFVYLYASMQLQIGTYLPMPLLYLGPLAVLVCLCLLLAYLRIVVSLADPRQSAFPSEATQWLVFVGSVFCLFYGIFWLDWTVPALILALALVNSLRLLYRCARTLDALIAPESEIGGKSVSA